jgi:hypothetical protein
METVTESAALAYRVRHQAIVPRASMLIANAPALSATLCNCDAV